jgi:hypothetical protein
VILLFVLHFSTRKKDKEANIWGWKVRVMGEGHEDCLIAVVFRARGLFVNFEIFNRIA